MTSVDWTQELLRSSETTPSRKISTTFGLIAAATSGGLAVGLMAVCGPFVIPAFRKICLPYVPATNSQVSNVLKVLKGRNCKSIVDLGSGDGRIVHALAEHKKNFGGSEFVGVELNPWLVLYSKLVAAKRFGSGRKSNVRFLRKDIWKYDLKKHDAVIVFGVECMMEELRLKSEKELRKGSTVVACRFPFESWTPTKVEGNGVDTVWLYER